MYNILFRAASETLKEAAANPDNLGAVIGYIAVLHTWGQNLMDHLSARDGDKQRAQGCA